MPSNHIVDYDETYIEACFVAWYKAGCPGIKTANNTPSAGGAHLIKTIPPDTLGRKPNIATVAKWMDKYDWRSRADALDAQVSIKIDNELILERVQTLKTLAENGKTLKEKGLKFLQDSTNPFADNPSAAVRAVVSGAEMEFKYAGQAAILENIANMSNKQLESEILRLLGKESDEPNENDETLDLTLEDIPSDGDSEDNDS